MDTTALATQQPTQIVLPLDAVQQPDQHPARVYLARLSPGSRETMRASLNTVAGLLSGGTVDAEAFPWTSICYQHCQAVRTALAERYAPSTANRHLSALRGVLLECWRLGFISAEAHKRATDIEPVRGSRLPAGRAIQQPELRALFTLKGAGPGDIRDRAILAVAYGCGLRRAEVVDLDVADVDKAAGSLKVRHGKGRKQRLVYLGNTASLVEAWLVVRGDVSGPLFPRVRKGGHVGTERMTGQSVRLVLEGMAEAAGVAHFSPHDLRRTFIGDLLSAGADISTAQQLAGHASVTTTARYDRRGEATKKRAAYLLTIPGVE